MTETIQASLIIVCIWFLFQEGSPLFFFRQYYDELTQRGKCEWMRKPLYGCLPCMSSVWGSSVYVWFHKLDFSNYLLFIFTLCGSLVIINRIVNELR